MDDATFPGERFDFSNDENSERSQFNSVNLRMAYDLTENITLDSETTYFWNDFLQLGDIDLTAVPQGQSSRQNDFENIEQEVRLSYDSDDLRATVGVFFTRFERDATGDFLLPGFTLIPIAPPASEVTIRTLTMDKVTNFAGFGEVEYDLLPELTLIAGMRYDIESFDSVTTSSFLSDDPTLSLFLPPPSDAEAIDSNFGAFLPKAGLVYSFNEDLSLGFTAQRGYRAGGASLQASSGEVVEFDPEKTWNFELAARSQWLDDRITANANVFYTRWTDQQVNVEGAIPVIDRFTDNAGRSRLFGGEVEVVVQATDNLDLFGSAAYVDTKLIEFTTNGSIFDGNEFPGAPRFTAAFGGTYAFDNGWFASADASFTDSAFSDVANTDALKTDARFLVNARAGYQDDNWEVFAYVRNLFDNSYATNRFASLSGITAQSGEPLTFGLIGQIRF
ncbi:MAG: TonB-dependent receptor [Pseudomonadota bacterium]